jgi:hypothetical protein
LRNQTLVTVDKVLDAGKAQRFPIHGLVAHNDRLSEYFFYFTHPIDRPQRTATDEYCFSVLPVDMDIGPIKL